MQFLACPLDLNAINGYFHNFLQSVPQLPLSVHTTHRLSLKFHCLIFFIGFVIIIKDSFSKIKSYPYMLSFPFINIHLLFVSNIHTILNNLAQKKAYFKFFKKIIIHDPTSLASLLIIFYNFLSSIISDKIILKSIIIRS